MDQDRKMKKRQKAFAAAERQPFNITKQDWKSISENLSNYIEVSLAEAIYFSVYLLHVQTNQYRTTIGQFWMLQLL